MDGQWGGAVRGDDDGFIILDMDDTGSNFSGSAIIYPDDPSAPSLVVRISTPDHSYKQVFTAHHIEVITPEPALLLSLPEAVARYPDQMFPTSIEIGLKRRGRNLAVVWKSSTSAVGTARLRLGFADQPSRLQPLEEITSWDRFREFAFSLDPARYMFRGQNCRRRLRTSFHRTKRKDIIGYLQRDIKQAHRALTARTSHLFNLQDPTENGAFLNLLQHHGYPTPLLDWTLSPFVAAFFAYRRPPENGEHKVRILIFDRIAWQRDNPTSQIVAFGRPHISVLEPLTIENNRAMPQQSLSTVTNMDDIETYIDVRESNTKQKYLIAIDLPANQRSRAMRDLTLMGISAGSLFPGLDGACEELRGLNFHPFT